MTTISLVSMVKNEEKNIRKMIESVLPIVDEICILDTGSTDTTLELVRAIADEHTDKTWVVKESEFKNFVDSKNDALAMPSSDYILFMDADEYFIEGLEFMRDFVSKGYPCASVMIREGTSVITTNQYPRPRLWKNDPAWSFKGPGVHEYLSGPAPPALVREAIVRHDHTFKNMSESGQRWELYLETLKDALQKNPDDPRARFYLARTLKDMTRPIEAIEEYERYLALGGNAFKDERWQAAYDIGVCYRTAGEYDLAKEAYRHAITIDPRRAEAYQELGELAYNLHDFEGAKKLFSEALSKDIPKDVSLFLNPQKYCYAPSDWLCRTEFKLKNFRKAKIHGEAATSSSGGYDDRLIRNVYWCNLKSNQNIFMTLGQTPEPVYGGIINDRGLGGVETTYVELAEFLSSRGHTVFLFCVCDNEHIYKGVYYVPVQNFNRYKTILPDVLITSRWFEPLFMCPQDAKRILWLQDSLSPGLMSVIPKADAVVFSSPWHLHYVSEHFADLLYGKKTEVIPLGIRTKLFKDERYKIPLRVIFSNSPDRGLSSLGDFWPELTERVPGITLTITYGWATADAMVENNKNEEFTKLIAAQKAEIMGKFEGFDNVRWTGRIKKQDLAREMLEAELCLYPSNFYETFCITGLETQAAGTPMITTFRGAMPTTLCAEGNVLIRAHETSEFYRKAFIDETVRLLTVDHDELLTMQAACRNAISMGNEWGAIAEKWETFIYGL